MASRGDLAGYVHTHVIMETCKIVYARMPASGLACGCRWGNIRGTVVYQIVGKTD